MSPTDALTGHISDLEAKAKPCFAKFEELRGFL